MYIVQSIVQVPEHKAEELVEVYRNRSRSVDRQPGFVSFQLLQSETTPGELIVHMSWDTKESYMAWVQSSDFKRIHELEKAYPDQELTDIKPAVRRYLVRAE
ncbi:antibiotic biosynthesis monooxygenase family protein [Paenibacillus bovis]|uniref:Antibiotic biosynthesis monooxygenase n=1 Tax=Paenibacillus bovis TaxID=1616788 RepID=A0A172ZGC6_9BACL|nr:antibiotic biosynthesis monooxygenase [Paenibacillus bovis]ANF96442.1 antibiotic biosynthesis monooxygenase [Paenibacillus bovis]